LEGVKKKTYILLAMTEIHFRLPGRPNQLVEHRTPDGCAQTNEDEASLGAQSGYSKKMRDLGR